MKFKKERVIIFLSITISLFVGYFAWDLISLDFQDVGIVGLYSQNEHNAKNDILRYITFVALPVLAFLILNFLYKKNSLNLFLNFFKFSTPKCNFLENKSLNYIFVFLSIIIIFEFLSVDFPMYLVDSFHEGQKLSAAYRFYLDNSLWSRSYITVGIFYETLTSVIFWGFFDNISIGGSRYGVIVYIFIFKITLLYFLYIQTRITNFNSLKQNVYFITNSILVFHIINYDLGSIDLISYRDLPVLLMAILFTRLTYTKNSYFIFTLISILSIFSLLWSVDRGFICNLLMIVIFIYLFLEKRNNEILIILLTTIFLWLIFYLIFKNEFKFFLENTYLVFKEMSYVHGIIHPQLFSDEQNSSRATKTILLIIIILLISINLMFKKNYPNNFSKLIIFLSVIAFGSYLYALGRSDGAHIKNSFGFPLITIFSYLIYVLLKKNFFSSKKLLISLSLIFIIFILINAQINPNYILEYKNRLNKYVYLPDEYFLIDKEIVLLNETKAISKKFDCIQLFSNDAIFYYLLRKKSCTKFYFVWSASSIFNQKRMISELKNAKLIITGGDKNNWDLPLEKKINLVHNHINMNYQVSKKIYNWSIYIRD
jgi:hypothetical protein